MNNPALATRPARLATYVAGLVMAGAIVLAVACGGGGNDDEEIAAVEAAVAAAFDAWNAGDLDGFLGALTDSAVESEFEATREEAADFLSDSVGDPQMALGEFSDTTISGSSATTVANFFIGSGGTPERFFLLRDGDVWLIDDLQPTTGTLPSGASEVGLSLSEYAFTFDEAALDSNVAFAVSNLGGERHFVDLVRVPADLDIEQALASEEEPEGIEEIASTDIIEPGGETTLFFTSQLDAGRYVMLCWIEDAEGTPHALNGMWAEFTLPAGVRGD